MKQTTEELTEKARQGYFWVDEIQKWYHYSQVDTQAKARRLLKRSNPIYVTKLAHSASVAVGPRLKGFWAWIFNHLFVDLLVILLTSLLSLILVIYDENMIIGSVVSAMMLCPTTIAVIMTIKLYRLDLDDAAYVLYVQAEDLKNGFIYDAFGDMQSFQHTTSKGDNS